MTKSTIVLAHVVAVKETNSHPDYKSEVYTTGGHVFLSPFTLKEWNQWMDDVKSPGITTIGFKQGNANV